MKDCITNGRVTKEKENAREQKSKQYESDKCQVTINPDTHELVQTNPSNKKR